MNLIFWSQDSDDDVRDPLVGGWLAEVDPGRDDPTYWMRFHRSVEAGSRMELRRRRRENELSVVGVMSTWSRAVVPAALAAATIAGFLLVRSGPVQDRDVLVEDVISLGMPHPVADDGEPEEEPDWATFASENY